MRGIGKQLKSLVTRQFLAAKGHLQTLSLLQWTTSHNISLNPLTPQKALFACIDQLFHRSKTSVLPDVEEKKGTVMSWMLHNRIVKSIH